MHVPSHVRQLHKSRSHKYICQNVKQFPTHVANVILHPLGVQIRGWTCRTAMFASHFSRVLHAHYSSPLTGRVLTSAYSLDRKVRTEASQMYSDPRSHSYEHSSRNWLFGRCSELDIQHQQQLHHAQRSEPEEQQFNYVLNYWTSVSHREREWGQKQFYMW